MKNVVKTLQAEKAEVEKEFKSLDEKRKEAIETRDKINAVLSQIVAQLTKLQGSWAAIDKLEQQFKDEPKEK